jgi:hypothetical protein
VAQQAAAAAKPGGAPLRTERADDEAMQPGFVRQRDEVRHVGHVHAERGAGGAGVAQQPPAERSVGPGLGDHPRAERRRARLHRLDLAADLPGGQHALLDQQFAHGTFEGEKAVLLGLLDRRVAIVVVVVMILAVAVRAAHGAACSVASQWA